MADGIALVFDGERLERLPAVRQARAAIESALDELEDVHRRWAAVYDAGFFREADMAMAGVRQTAEDYGRVEAYAAVERSPLAQVARRAVLFSAAALGLVVGVMVGGMTPRR